MVLTSLKHINYIKSLCLLIKVKIRIAVFYGLTRTGGPEDDLCIG